MDNMTKSIILSTTDTIPNKDIEICDIIFTTTVLAANVIKDIKENIVNLIGGEMTHYSNLLDEAVKKALANIQQKALENGYDGILGIRISHPSVVQGAAEVIVYGTGFRYISNKQ